MEFQTVVVPIDGSTVSRHAVPAAAAVAAAGEAKVRLVAVAHDEAEVGWRYDQLHGEAELMPSDVTCSVDVVVDSEPVDVLLDIARDPSNVLCLGVHDAPWLAAIHPGRVASHLAVRTSRPFLVVAAGGQPPARDADVVAALDGVSDPEPGLTAAGSWARRLGTGLRIVTVFEPTPPDLRRPDHYTRRIGPPGDAEEYLDGVRSSLAGAGLPTCTVAAIADPVNVSAGLMQHLADHPASILVLGGSRGRRWPGTVARDLLATSPPPMLVAQYHGVL
jgi:nucleotide-binding universal stress UspA family protein